MQIHTYFFGSLKVIGSNNIETNEIFWCLDTNWEQFFIYFNFNCTIEWILTYLVLLYPKDQMITFRTQKYLNKLMHVVHPVL